MGERRSWLTLPLIVSVVFIAAGCTFVQGRLRISADMKGIGYDQAFQIATNSAMDAGFTITSAAKDSGMITAARGNSSFLITQRETLYIDVLSDGSKSTLSVAGEASNYAEINSALNDF